MRAPWSSGRRSRTTDLGAIADCPDRPRAPAPPRRRASAPRRTAPRRGTMLRCIRTVLPFPRCPRDVLTPNRPRTVTNKYRTRTTLGRFRDVLSPLFDVLEPSPDHTCTFQSDHASALWPGVRRAPPSLTSAASCRLLAAQRPAVAHDAPDEQRGEGSSQPELPQVEHAPPPFGTAAAEDDEPFPIASPGNKQVSFL